MTPATPGTDRTADPRLRLVSRLLLAAALTIATPAIAQGPADAPPPAAEAPAQPQQEPRPTSGILSLLPQGTTTRHSLKAGDVVLDYMVTAGTQSLRDGTGTVTADIFHVAYRLADGAKDRPVTFVFNGGPGAASAYLHLGALGPRVIDTSAAGDFLPPPQRLIDNPDTWLDLTDLVFVDPPGTGYSRGADQDQEARFWSVDRDAEAMAAFIRLYLQSNDRMGAPVYLAGESYGGFRAARLAKTLQETAGIAPSGAILISPALEFSLLYGEDYEPLTWALTLPSLAAVRLEKEGVRGGGALRERLAEVERYALSDYLVALAAGAEAAAERAGETVARYTGLPVEEVRRRYARVPVSVFIKQFDKGRLLSRYDGSIAGPDVAPEANNPLGPDPILDRSVPALTSAFVAYARDELGYRTDITYRLLNSDIAGRWDYGGGGSRQGYAGVLGDLQEARALNPALEVLIVHGYTDLVTPYMASEYLVRQLPPLIGARPIRTRVYEGGHMMYLRADARRALKEDVRSVYAAGGSPGEP
ncbi:S10 family peptidase [Chthonobacter rhizosphaerae]|uniref:S10 family peptidase n=1 Tax=Chthonobacter rhizosphaerae TaxID=2735553 RepID=UPI0015EFA4EC|nr:peptidase S10 [Chthonobacter rhizosphaerae]